MADEMEHKQPALVHWILDHPKLAGFGAAIALAVGFSPKASVMASWVCLSVAVVFGIAMLFGIGDKRSWGKTRTIVSICLFVVLIAGFGLWLTDGKKVIDNWYLAVFKPDKASADPTAQAQKPKPETPLVSAPAEKRTSEFRPKNSTICTMKKGRYYSDYLKLPGGPKLQRPMIVVNTGTLPYVATDVTGDPLLFVELVLTNRGEASIVKNWEVCLIHDKKPFIYDSVELPAGGVLIAGTDERITPEKSLVENVIRTPLEHAHTAGGWVAFKISKELEDSWASGKEVVSGSIRFKDYLDHEYSFDFGNGSNGQIQTYLPGAPPLEHLTAQCYLELFGQVNGGAVTGMVVNQTPEPMDDVRMDVMQLLDKPPSDADPNPNSKLVGWQKRLDIGTCRARLSDGLSERFPIGDHDHLSYSVWISSRYWTFRETIELKKISEREYSERVVVYRAADKKPLVETETKLSILQP